MLTTIDANELAITDQRPLDQNPAAVYLGSLAPKSRITMLQALCDIAELLGTPPTWQDTLDKRGNPTRRNMSAFVCRWQDLRYQHTAAIRAQLAARNSAATVNKKLCALRGVLHAAWQLGQMSAEDYYRARDIKAVAGTTLPAGRALEQGEIRALAEICKQDASAAGKRDAAIIGLMYCGGLRRDEVARIDLADYDPQTGRLEVKHGKRNKQRVSFLKNGTARAMADWLTVRGSEPGALFCPVNKSGKVDLRPLTNQAIYNMLAKRGELAGVKKFSPHDLRRTCISHMLDNGVDVITVAKKVGHSSTNTTGRYDRRGERAIEKADELLFFPY